MHFPLITLVEMIEFVVALWLGLSIAVAALVAKGAPRYHGP